MNSPSERPEETVDGLHHQVAHPQAAECFARGQVPGLGARGAEQEPADEREPGAAEGVRDDEEGDAAGDQEIVDRRTWSPA